MVENHETILDAFLHHVDTAPINLLAGSHGEVTIITRQELYARGCALAQEFVRLGIQIGDIVMTILPTGMPFLVSTFGAWLSGAAIAPIAPPAPGKISEYYQRKLTNMIRTAQPKIIVASELGLSVLNNLSELTENVRILRDENVLVSFQGKSLPLYIPKPDDIAHIQFTSGSTSFPKCAVIKHKQIAANVRGIGKVVCGGEPTNERVVSWLPVHHDMGFIGGLCYPFYHGNELHLIPTETFIRNPAIWLRVMSDARGTLSPAPTFAYDLLGSRVSETRLQGIDLSSWQYAWVGAEPIFFPTLQKFNDRFRSYGLREETLKPCYGLAEATLAVTLSPLNNSYKVEWVDQQSLRKEGFAKTAVANENGSVPITCCGMPIAETIIRIVNENGETINERQQGRILVRGTSVMEGYLGDVPSPLYDGWLDTGDLGFKIGEEFYITGRAKDLLIRGGVNIHPQEIERIADKVDGVRMGTATAFSYIRNDVGREEIVLIVETRQQKPEIRRGIIEEIRHKVTQEVNVQVDQIELVAPGTVPKTTSGKIQRSLCREIFLKSQNNDG